MKLELVKEVVNADTTVRDVQGNVRPHASRGFGIDLYIDTETGVQYFVMNEGVSSAMCPRYNADGSLYVTINI